MTDELKARLRQWAEEYNDPRYFAEDPIAFPTNFASAYKAGTAFSGEGSYILADVEIAAIFAAHFAWGRRAMIVRDCERLFGQMNWRPYDYVMSGKWRDDDSSVHRTIKWSETAAICSRLKRLYEKLDSLESLDQGAFRREVFGQKDDPKAANKKINMMRRWMVRRDGKVDLGLWTHSSTEELLIPLDVHVYDMAVSLGLTSRKSKDLTTVKEITGAFGEVFPGDPCKGDFALFGYGIAQSAKPQDTPAE